MTNRTRAILCAAPSVPFLGFVVVIATGYVFGADVGHDMIGRWFVAAITATITVTLGVIAYETHKHEGGE